MRNKRINDQDVVVDECPQCKGMWFDQGELDKVMDDVSPDLRWMDFDLWKKEGDFRVLAKPANCPNCHNTNLRALHYDGGDVTINYCPRCQGIWINAGDIRKIVIALNKEAEEKSAAEYVKASLKEAAELITTPENFISEWRDLKAVVRLLKYRFFVENPKVKDILVGLQKSLPL
jgi:Zn-finger nucleic acid-binding protein